MSETLYVLGQRYAKRKEEHDYHIRYCPSCRAEKKCNQFKEIHYHYVTAKHDYQAVMKRAEAM